jgi:hypothetical protein
MQSSSASAAQNVIRTYAQSHPLLRWTLADTS